MKSIIDDNLMIAEFMELKPDANGVYWYTEKNGVDKEYLKYNILWDNWLMPVVEKIEAMQNTVSIIGREVVITNRFGIRIAHVFDDRVPFKTKVQAVYNAVVIFIKWYNTHKV